MTTQSRQFLRGTTLTLGLVAASALALGAGIASAAAEPVADAPLATITTLEIDPLQSMAGIGPNFDITVSAPGCVTGPAGTFTLSAGGLWSETLTVYLDPLAADVCSGMASLTTSEIPAGMHRATVTYTPADPTAFAGSAAGPLAFDILPWETRVGATGPGTVAAGQAVQVTAAVATVAPEGWDPEADVQTPWGSVQAVLGDRVLAEAADIDEGSKSLNLGVLPSGRHTITVRYVPGTSSLVASETTVQVVVAAAAPKPAVRVDTGAGK